MKIQVRADDAVSETNEWSGNKVTHTLALILIRYSFPRVGMMNR